MIGTVTLKYSGVKHFAQGHNEGFILITTSKVWPHIRWFNSQNFEPLHEIQVYPHQLEMIGMAQLAIAQL